jgi:hypothetical protein
MVRRGLQDTELVAVRIFEYVPAPAVLADLLAGGVPRSCSQEPGRFGGEVVVAQVEVHPVLAALAVVHLLQQQLDPPTVGGHQPMVASRRVFALRSMSAVADIAEGDAPEGRCSIEVRTVEHNHQYGVRASVVPDRFTLHLSIVHSEITTPNVRGSDLHPREGRVPLKEACCSASRFGSFLPSPEGSVTEQVKHGLLCRTVWVDRAARLEELKYARVDV